MTEEEEIRPAANQADFQGAFRQPSSHHSGSASAFDRVRAALERSGPVQISGKSIRARCPGHDDRMPSLLVTPTEGMVLIHCFAGCEPKEIVDALGLTLADLFDENRGGRFGRWNFVDSYRYDNGRMVYRTVDKDFPQSGTDKPPELYRLSKVRAAVSGGDTIYVVEGEKDVHAAEAIGLVATCAPMGAGNWGKVDPSPLYGANVVVIADRDGPGEKHAADVVASLNGRASVRSVIAAVGKDLADHIAAGLGADDLVPTSRSDNDGSVHETGSASGERNTAAEPGPWSRIDLSEMLDGTTEPERPTLLPRTDGNALLYLGRVHSVHGESESGKSFILQAEVARLLRDGQAVAYVDYESDERSVVARLLALGAPAKAIAARFYYVRPDAPPGADPMGFGAILQRQFALVVLDGVTEALATSGLASTDNDEVARWMREVPKRIAACTGAAVVLIDHVTKSHDSRGRFAIGAQAKLSGLTGAAYTVDVAAPLGKGMVGVLELRVGKDRPGGVRPICGSYNKLDRTQLAAVVTINAIDPENIVVTVAPEDRPNRQSGPFRPTALMEKVSRFIEDAAIPPGIRDIRSGVKGKNAAKETAITTLIAEGFVSATPNGQKSEHRSLRPYRQVDDPDADAYSAGHGKPPGSTAPVPVPIGGGTGHGGRGVPGHGLGMVWARTGATGEPARGNASETPIDGDGMGIPCHPEQPRPAPALIVGAAHNGLVCRNCGRMSSFSLINGLCRTCALSGAA